MKTKIVLFILLQSALAFSDGTDLAICHRPQVCPPIGIGDLSSQVTTQGNSFNGPSQLVQLLGNGKLPALDGSNLTNVGGGGSPGGASTAIQFNLGGLFTGTTNFQYDPAGGDNAFGQLSLRGTAILTSEDQNVSLTIGDSGFRATTGSGANQIAVNPDGTTNIDGGNTIHLGANTVNIDGTVNVPSPNLNISGVNYAWPNTAGAADSVLRSDGSSSPDTLSWVTDLTMNSIAAATLSAGYEVIHGTTGVEAFFVTTPLHSFSIEPTDTPTGTRLHTLNQLLVNVSGTDILDIQDSGLVGINNNAPAYALDVVGGINTSDVYHVSNNDGVSGTFTAQSGETITIIGGIITAITPP